MVAAAFPLAKLAVVAVKQISKPLAAFIKERAKNSYFFRTHICMPPAQIYHWAEVRIRMRMMNLGKPTEVPKLNENMAIELGADILGEAVVFTVASTCLLLEFMRQSVKEREKEIEKNRRLNELENRVYELEFIVTEQEARLRQTARNKFPGFRAAWKSPLAKTSSSSTDTAADTTAAVGTTTTTTSSATPPGPEKQDSRASSGSGAGETKKMPDDGKPDGILGRTLSGLMSAFKP